ncbi:2OG-Fe dioxygenase family protein [Streptomyces albiaxialis]|uniref:2OG-Fe dioxygenase family protein n=1 Tax=Streptomyces albiaxialis TaxID=329523 RepID=A0ABN2W5V4_9ACTN
MRLRLLNASGKISDELIESFSELTADNYLKSRVPFRFRAFASALVKGDTLRWTDDDSFFQDTDINMYAGGVERRFPQLGAPAREFAERLVLAPEVRRFVGAEEFTAGCHQIRVVATDDQVGLPAPEGFHRDGFDRVAVTCVAVENVSGAISLVRARSGDEERGEERGEEGDDVLLDRTMPAGETLLFDDTSVLHYVTPMTPKFPERPAYRDVVVITFAKENGGAPA